MTDSIATLPEAIECPLCLGKGRLGRTEVFERLGMKDFARVAQLSAEEAVRLLAAKDKDAEQARWSRFESELAKRAAEATGKHNAELQKAQAEKSELAARLKGLEENSVAMLGNARQQERLASEKAFQKQLAVLTKRIADLEASQKLAQEQKQAEVARLRAELEAALNKEKSRADDLSRQTKDRLQEISALRERNKELESDMVKAARIGKREETDFAEEARSWPGIWVGEKLPRNGDYQMAFSDATGNALEPFMLVDNKDKATVAESDIRKLVRDARRRKLPVAVLVARYGSQLRHADRRRRWAQEDGIWLLRTSRSWLPRDLEVLRPVFQRVSAEGSDFLQKNAALSDEVRRTLAEVDEIDSQLRKAEAAIGNAQALTAKHRARLAGLCETGTAGREMPSKRMGKNGKGMIGNGNGNQERLLREGGTEAGFP
jgi:hypothetical protein